MEEKTQLEIACEKAVGKEHKQYYQILSELLLLNPEMLKPNDTRFSAQVTSILVNDEIKNKDDLICELLETNENRIKTRVEVLDYTKSLLELDPKLVNTSKILGKLKDSGDSNYSEIMRKVNLKHVMKMYYTGETATRRRI